MPDLSDARLIVGNDERDDAAVYDLGDGTGVISTTDFFMPIVDDPFDFGRIASVNSLSDVWAMGGTPLMAIAILGWPIDRLAADIANQVVEGARAACRDAGVVLAGGHSIDNPEPVFGLAVTGRVSLSALKRNSGGRPGDYLVLSKAIGTGVLTTALKRGLLEEAHTGLATATMLQDNRVGARLGGISGVHAMTDVTGFGLLGHTHEMALGAECEAVITADAVPLIDSAAVPRYVAEGAVPGGAHRNWESYGHHVSGIDAPQDNALRSILCDPQTAGGLLVAVAPEDLTQVQELLSAEGRLASVIGRFRAGEAGKIRVVR